jgi:hypothetical protein
MMAKQEGRNYFKAPKKLADGSLGDLRSHCECFKMTAVDEKDMQFLSHLYRTIWLQGGSVTIDDGAKKQTYSF